MSKCQPELSKQTAASVVAPKALLDLVPANGFMDSRRQESCLLIEPRQHNPTYMLCTVNCKTQAGEVVALGT